MYHNENRMGLLFVQGLAHRLCQEVIAIDIDDHRLDLSTQLVRVAGRLNIFGSHRGEGPRQVVGHYPHQSTVRPQNLAQSQFGQTPRGRAAIGLAPLCRYHSEWNA